jgi:serine/threonine protein kinase
MNPQRPNPKALFTEQAEEIFCAAMGYEKVSDRLAYLDQSCAGAPELRTKVEALLAAHEAATQLFDQTSPALVVTEETCRDLISDPKLQQSAGLASAVDERLGTRIGPYRLAQVLGEGGCGVVYLAEQETPVRRQVALKIIKLGMDTKSVITRFEAERQALAMMDHPNIAHVLDAGATEQGRPYFVMELVRGVKVTSYCNQNQLGLPARLQLFIQICHALQHAHQKGIIHRDIKPSNLLVTLHDGVPVPKVIDFGIAKAVEGRLTDETMFTPYAHFIGTPAYMSPEQAQVSRLDVDTRSDIYSLGVLLYELLTGRTPFDTPKLLKAGVDEMRRTLLEQDPPRPSARLTSLSAHELTEMAHRQQAEPASLSASLHGDLDWIVMKALEKDRNRRYQTANALAADVQRYLNNEPVAARPPSRVYRLQKLVRRNKVIFAAGSAVALALAAGLGITLVLLVRERELRQEQARLRIVAEHGLAVETELRRQTEWREAMREATGLIQQKAYPQADLLLAALPSEPATMEGAEVLRTLGEWHALNGRWPEARRRYDALLRANRFDNPVTASLDFTATAIAILKCDDQEGYDRFRKEINTATVSTTDPIVAERTIKSCLLRPAPKELMDQLRPLARVAEAHAGRKDYGPAAVTWDVPWRCLTLALWKYREGRPNDALTWAQRCLSGGETPLARSASAQVIRAMALYRLRRVDEARAELKAVRVVVEPKLKKLKASDDGTWFDWLVCQILLEEAVATIEGK